MRALRQFLAIQWSEASVDWRPMLLSLAGLLLGLLSQLYLGRFVDAVPHPQLGGYAASYSAFLLIGLALLELQSSIVGALALRVREAQRSGALEVYLATPIALPTLLLGLVVYDAGFALLRLIGYFLVGVLLFSVPVVGVHWPALLAAVTLGWIAFGGLALVSAALTLELRRSDPLSLLLGALSIIACDVLYPSKVLPSALRGFGQILPLGPALETLRGALRGECCTAALVWLAIQGIVLVLVGILGFSWAYRRARQRGTLSAP